MFGSVYLPLLCLVMLAASLVHGCPASKLPLVGDSTNNGDGTYVVGEVVTYTCNDGYNYVIRPETKTVVPVTCSLTGDFIGNVPTCLADGADYGMGTGCEDSGMCCPGQDNTCYTQGSCYCDDMCMTYGDCCADYYTYCKGVVVEPEPVVCAASGLPSKAHASHDGDGTYILGDVVTYTCSASYVFVTSANTKLVCSSAGTFTGTVSSCLKECPASDLPTVVHADHNGDGLYMDGDEITYTCHSTYILQDANKNKKSCSELGTFTGASPVCLKVCLASALPTVLDSVHNGAGTYQEGDVVTFTCNPGYLLVQGAPSAITCLSDSSFSGTPACYKSVSSVCYPNGTIVLANPDPAIYKSAHAADTDNACVTSWMAKDTIAKGWLEITGCAKGDVIVVSFSDRDDDTDEIYGGSKVASYAIKCEEISPEGVAMTFTQGLAPKLSTASEAPVLPTIEVLSAFRKDSAVGEVQTTATVGEDLYWTIDIPEDYRVIPVSCTAYAGSSTQGTPSELLLTDGCTADTYLLESFSDEKVLTELKNIRRYYTKMWAFKFQSKDTVFFHCNIKFCPASSTHCNIDCDSPKKRSAELGEGEMYGTTSRVLRVKPAEEFISSSTISRIEQDLAIACGITLLIWGVKAMFV